MKLKSVYKKKKKNTIYKCAFRQVQSLQRLRRTNCQFSSIQLFVRAMKHREPRPQGRPCIAYILHPRSGTSQSRVRQVAGALGFETRLRHGFESSSLTRRHLHPLPLFLLLSTSSLPPGPTYIYTFASACFSGCRCPKVFARRQDISSGRSVARSSRAEILDGSFLQPHILPPPPQKPKPRCRRHSPPPILLSPPPVTHPPPRSLSSTISRATFFFSPGFLLFRSRSLPSAV